MSRVAALYRYPVKGLTPESCESLEVLPEGRIAGDRALAFRFADSGLPPHAWSRKYGYAVLVNTPGLAKLAARFDPQSRRLRIAHGDVVLADEAIDGEGREKLAAAVERYVLSLADNPLSGHHERLPLQLIGDGVTPRYQDSESGQVTLHSRSSVAALGHALGDAALDETRFRSNIAIEGVPAWTENEWIGRRLRIGEVELEAVKDKVRCLATHANPKTGERDLPVMQTLTRAFAQAQPTLAIGLLTRGAGGTIRLGDPVTVLD
ncbi:MAG TPA: MOSC domain-containing protein [Burkholderiales bacterium]|nr:MOSC domain-containing protein [Burkholderiales bacterium]